MAWIWFCVIAYIGIGVGHWKLTNLISNVSFESMGWLIGFTIIWPLMLLIQLFEVFYASIFWALTYKRKTYKWTEYIQKQLEWD